VVPFCPTHQFHRRDSPFR